VPPRAGRMDARSEILLQPGSPAVTGVGRPARMVGIDVARALAIVGMVTVHFRQPQALPPETWLEQIQALPNGRASLLFVLLAGVGLTFLAGNRDGQRWHRATPFITARVVVLLPLGLGLELAGMPPLVILQYYAVLFLLAMPACLWGDRALLCAAGGLAVVGPIAYLLLSELEPSWFVRANPAALDDPPMVIARELLFTGSYPAMVWLAPMLFGMWIGRQDLRAPHTRTRMFLAGAVVAILAALGGAWLPAEGWWRLADARPHSQMFLWLVGGTGTAVAILAGCLVLADRLGRVLAPLGALGQLALTVYVAHLLLLLAWQEAFTPGDVRPALLLVAGFACVAAGFACFWRRWFAYGPLEAMLHAAGHQLGRLQRRL